MRKNLQARQERLRERNSRPVKLTLPKQLKTIRREPKESKPINWTRLPVYGAVAPTSLPHFPKISGVYLLAENGKFYIGESMDVCARIIGHRTQVSFLSCSSLEDPKGILLAEVPIRPVEWRINKTVRLIAERRFICAALNMCLPLTNKECRTGAERLKTFFADVEYERHRLEIALKILC